MKEPNYASTPTNAISQLSVANTNRNGTGTLVTLIEGGANGVSVQDIMLHATGTTAAGFIFLYLSNGTTNSLILEHPVTAITPSATVSAWNSFISDFSVVLAPGWSLKASTYVANTFMVSILRASYF